MIHKKKNPKYNLNNLKRERVIIIKRLVNLITDGLVNTINS